MSRKALVVAALLAVALSSGTARAQAGFGLAAGLSAPMGDFGKIADAGYHVTGLMSYAPRLSPAGLRVEGSFSEFNYNSTIFSSAQSAKARVLSATANAVLASPGVMGPYVIGGVGVYRASAECSTCSSTSTKGGINVGGGFRFALTGFSAFLEARYHYIPGASDPTNGGIKSSTQFVPISFGLVF
jgi:opacity protein-like surface antigen